MIHCLSNLSSRPPRTSEHTVLRNMFEARKRVFFAVHATQGVTWGLLLWPVEGVTRDDMIELFARHLERILLDPEVGEQVREHPPIDSLRTAMIPRT